MVSGFCCGTSFLYTLKLLSQCDLLSSEKQQLRLKLGMSKRLMEDGGLHVDEPAIFSNGFTRRKPTAVIDSVERYR